MHFVSKILSKHIYFCPTSCIFLYSTLTLLYFLFFLFS